VLIYTLFTHVDLATAVQNYDVQNTCEFI